MFIGIAANTVQSGAGAIWTPGALGSSLLGWWDAEDASTITQSGGLVSSWKDKVAGYDATQATGSLKAVFSATSFNGRPGLSFDGVDDYLELPSVPFPAAADASDVWVLADQTLPASDLTGRIAFGYGDLSATSRRVWRVVNAGVNNAQMTNGNGGGTTVAIDAGVDLSGRHVMHAAFGAASSSIQTDNSTGASAAVTPSTATSRTRIGAANAGSPSNYWQGVFNSVLVTAPLSAPQAAQLLAYLKARGGIS